jgi:hypothetical protein
MSTVKSSSANLTLNADGSGNDIKFQSNAVEKASIDQDGNVAASGTITSNGQAQLNNNNLISTNTGSTGEWIGKRTSSGEGIHITTTNASGTDTQRLAITCNADSADFIVKDSDIVFGTAGKGICLGVTSNTDANTLDDYEEGTWTPTYLGGSGNPTVGYAAQIGTYVKIGKFCICSMSLNTSSVSGGSSSSDLYVGGLPFTCSATSGASGGLSTVRTQNWVSSARSPVGGYVNANTAFVNLNSYDYGEYSTQTICDTDDLRTTGDSNQLTCSLVYQTA